MLTSIVGGDRKHPFSIATILRSSVGQKLFSLFVPSNLDSYIISMNLKRRGMLYKF